MKVLTINCGSSTLKFEVIDVDGEASHGNERKMARGIVDGIGGCATLDFSTASGRRLKETSVVSDHGDATRLVLTWLGSNGITLLDQLGAIGHRVVHGGDRFVAPTVIDETVVNAIDALSDLAPLHNEPSLAAIRAARAAVGSAIPMVAIFDTTFHHTMPLWASLYAIPKELLSKHHIRRYGFHGLAHRYMTERYCATTSMLRERTRLITLQLGNGCSATAVKEGHSVETSMGFTPLEGLVMGTRSGNVDPSLPGFLAQREGVDVKEIERWLNTRSGLLGVSGSSPDMRELLKAERAGDSSAALAVEMFCYRVRQYIGAYMAVLGGADAIVFGGGIGENAPEVRSRICDNMEWCGVKLDQDRNNSAIGLEAKISADDAVVDAYVIPVDEAVIIASDTVNYLRQHSENE